jgi:hypothetical protein
MEGVEDEDLKHGVEQDQAGLEERALVSVSVRYNYKFSRLTITSMVIMLVPKPSLLVSMRTMKNPFIANIAIDAKN